MHEILAILICVLAVLGLYAILSRLAVALLPRGTLLLTVDGAGKGLDEILLSVSHARLFLEREGRLSERIAVLLDGHDTHMAEALRKEGILICILK